MRRFRYDINGLRALAVGSVLLFHFGLPLFRGGFIGVDVFFVISGFLMTQIIVGELLQKRFKLWSFYGARARRIVPALLILCVALIGAGCFLIDPLALQRLSREALSALFFVSNFLFAKQQGYFAPDAQRVWFMHTWSLAVEWQFYLLYPVALIVLWRWERGRSALWSVIAIATLVSFAATVAISGMDAHYAKWAFFMLPTRAWEMLLGGLIALLPERARPVGLRARTIELGGLLLIVGSALALSERIVWPSAWTALPVVGAAMVILSDNRSSRWARAPGIQALGRWSYSVYLWHWPVLVGMNYLHVPELPAYVALAIVASVALGAISYNLVEVRLRRSLFEGQSNRARVLQVITVAVVAAAATAGLSSSGFEALRIRGFPTTVKAELIDYRSAMQDWSFDEVCRPAGALNCRVGDGSSAEVLVIGDSHAQQLAQRYGGLKDQSIAFVTRGGCPPVPGVGRVKPGFDCQAFTEAAFRKAVHGRYRRVVITADWYTYFGRGVGQDSSIAICFGPVAACRIPRTAAEQDHAFHEALAGLQAEIRRFEDGGAEVVLLLDMPWREDNNPARLYAAAFTGGDSRPKPFPLSDFAALAGGPEREVAQAAAAAGAVVVRPSDFLCAEGMCPTTEDGHYLFKDGNHYRARALRSPRFAFLDRYLLASASERVAGVQPGGLPHEHGLLVGG